MGDVQDIDAKLAEAIERLHLRYKEEFDKKKCIIMIPLHTSLHMSPSSITKIPPKPKVKTIEVSICKATKMDGNKCTCKAKPGLDFCGRHLPKK